MDVKIANTNITSLEAKISFSELLRILGLAATLGRGIKSDQPGATVTVAFGAADEVGSFETTVSIVVDHNYTATPPDGDEAATKVTSTAPAAIAPTESAASSADALASATSPVPPSAPPAPPADLAASIAAISGKAA